MALTDYRYIVVEGSIGVGKTSLAKRLAAHLGANALLEKPEDNPFLTRFYQNPDRYALPTQLFFLFQRINELSDLAQIDLFHQPTISDYLFQKNALFAQLTLNDDEYALYQSIYNSVTLKAPKPDLVILLQARTEVLLERIQKRGHPAERNLTGDYLARLASRYNHFFHHYDEAPVLIVNSERLNLANDTDDFSLLLDRIDKMRGQREFFNVGN